VLLLRPCIIKKMLDIDLMELADLHRPKDIVSEIYHQNPGWDEPVSLEELADRCGIKEIRYESLKGIEGALIANDTKSEGIIVINSDARHHRRRYTLGHELGHYLIPHHGFQMSCTSKDMSTKINKDIKMNSSQNIEAEANEFSANLLMPEPWLNKQKCFSREPSIECIKFLADKLDVSFQACANRYADLHDRPVAVVFSHMLKVQYGYTGGEHPFWLRYAKRGSSIPNSSLTASLGKVDDLTFHNDECDASLWFDENKYYCLPETCIEEVYVQEDGYIATLLWFEDEIEEKEEE